MRKALPFFLTLLAMGFQASCQLTSEPFLSLQKPLKYRNIVYRVGDDITIKLPGQKKPRTAPIFAIEEFQFKFYDTIIRYSDIVAVVRNKEERGSGFVNLFHKNIWKIGLAYPVIDLINNGFPPTKATYIIPASGIGAALLTLPFVKRTHRSKNGWRLHYLDLRPPRRPPAN